MKRRYLCLLLSMVLLLLVGCGARTDEGAEEGGEVTDAVDREVAARLLYYEQLVNDLQSELLAMRAELFSAKTEYSARLEELEASLAVSGALPFTYTVSEAGVTVTAYTGSDVSVSIPATIDGRAVIAIGDRAFMNCKTVQSVVVPEGVREIGWFAFSGCISLGGISLPSSVEAISYGAFENCPSALTVFCQKGSYAQKYAESYGIATVN